MLAKLSISMRYRPPMPTVPAPTGRLPRVWVRVGTEGQIAGLIAWGRATDGTWWAGACWPDARTMTLYAGWWPADAVLPERDEDTSSVPRVDLPAWHPGGYEWTGAVERRT